ncbi:GntR family transcriptional regulator [Staphylococcus lutrae]|nr:GntR family transcriptional regulator [Staphylococcus lutrae]
MIYNTLYEEIQMGKFPSGQALPTEKELCERFGVSRMTLRQAIKILTEDGVVESIRGKGHFVLPQSRTHQVTSIETFHHPLEQLTTVPMAIRSVNYRVDLESEYTNHLFPNHPKAVIAMERYYQCEDRTSQDADAFCFTFIPFYVIETFNIQAQHEAHMIEFVEKTIYQHATQSNLKCSITEEPHFGSDSFVFDGGHQCWLIVEKMYAYDLNPIMVNKWYVPHEHAELMISRVKSID